MIRLQQVTRTDEHGRRCHTARLVTAFAITSAIGETVKHLVARQRPAFHYEVESATEFASYPSERNKSFFPNDTAWAFAMASSSTNLTYLHGYSTAPYSAIGGGALAINP
jgi:hypothetical protein